ncbi:MAG: pyridoxal phosphate-dependent aminotransferase [Candidatus Bathyarchaeia archaeon]
MERSDYRSFLLPLPPKSAISLIIARANERKEKGLPVVDFSSGNVGMLPYHLGVFNKLEIQVNEKLNSSLKLVAEAIRKGILDAYYPNPSALSYSPTGGTISAKKQVIRYFREVHGVPLMDSDLNRVVVTAGGQQALSAALRSIKPKTKVMMYRWDYPDVSSMIKAQNCEEVRVEADEDLSIDRGDFESKVSEGSVFYISMPNNPSGYVSTSDFEFLAEKVHEMNGGLIWDAPYIFTILRLTTRKAYFDKAFMLETQDKFKSITQKYFEDMCILSSTSKTCLLAGLRFGFATACSHWVGVMDSIIGRDNLSSPTPSFILCESALRMFLDNPITHEWLCEVLASRLTVLMEEGLPLLLPRNGSFGALYVLLRTKGVDGAKFAEELIDKYGIVTVSGDAFYGRPVEAVRLSLVATPWTEGDEVWVRNVKTLKNSLKNLG